MGPLATFLLFGVDQIGVDLEQPFRIALPLDLLADRVKANALETLRMGAATRDVVELLVAAPPQQQVAAAAAKTTAVL